ncbi:MAG: hypothetical protein LBT49_01630 [Prevotellaceae bacterium]|jgi:hypothetical protein|nr:hypothetical protein [Prevotellaceae bacterium]
MEQRDYLKRQIDQIGVVLGYLIAYLLNLKTGTIDSIGVEKVRQVLNSEFDIDIDTFLTCKFEDIIHILNKKGFDYEDINKLVEILVIIADNMNTNNSKKNALYQLCLKLDEYIIKESSTFSFERHFRMEQIKKYVSNTTF